MDPASTWQIVTLVVLVSLSAFFSGTETAFTSFNKTRMKTMAQNGDKKARSVMWVEEHYEKFLSTILVGNNIVNISASTISALLFASLLKGNANVAATVSTIVMTVVVLIFGEITPKFLGKDFADNYTLKTAGIVRFLMTVLTPLTAFFSLWRLGLSKVVKGDPALSITEDEIMTMVDEAQSEGGIDEHEGDLIRSAIEFNDLEVSTILTPRVDIVNRSIKECLGRTINTTLTTLVTIVCLYIFGVSSIREFALPIIVGIISGVYSANMINGYVWAFLEEKKRAKKAAKA